VDPTLLPEGSKIIKGKKNSIIMTQSKLKNESKLQIKKDDDLNKEINKNLDNKYVKYHFVEKFLEDINKPIIIQNLTRPFSIFLKGLELIQLNKPELKKKMTKSVSKNLNGDNLTVTLLLKIQIFCGSEPFSNARMIKWKGLKDDKYPVLNKRIYFDLQYYKLPMFSSIVFKIKKLLYNKNNDLTDHETLAWANFRLFDHNRRLKTGKINLHLGWA
jgi:hypothetical protein